MRRQNIRDLQIDLSHWPITVRDKTATSNLWVITDQWARRKVSRACSHHNTAWIQVLICSIIHSPMLFQINYFFDKYVPFKRKIIIFWKQTSLPFGVRIFAGSKADSDLFSTDLISESHFWNHWRFLNSQWCNWNPNPYSRALLEPAG